MAMLVITTQYYENYGSTENPYWKAKGGEDYKITNVPLNIDFAEVVAAAGIGYVNDYAKEFVIDWFIEGDDYLTDYERSQIKYDGSIVYPAQTLEYSNLTH